MHAHMISMHEPQHEFEMTAMTWGLGDCDQRRPRGGWKRESGSSKRCGAGHMDKLRHCLL
jgi:hypothetical protein